MSRLPRYRRGSFVPHLIVLVLLLGGGLVSAGDGIDETSRGAMVARAATPEGPVGSEPPLPRTSTLDTVVTPGTRTYLAPNRPNPFRESTMIEFSIAERSTVTLTVYDFWYNEVETLIDNQELDPGPHLARFQVAPSERHPVVFSGMYFYELRVGDEVYLRRMLVIK